MADFTQTITNTLNTFGISAGNQWGFMVWNDEWGASEDIGTGLDKEPLVLPLAIGETEHLDFVKAPYTNTIGIAAAIDPVMRAFGIWDYVFEGPTTDGTERVFDQFTKVADGDDDFTVVSEPSTTWTKV